MKTYFISDLHLDVSRPQTTQVFLSFLSDLSSNASAERLYILGDLFEYWLGDDVLDHASGKALLPLFTALKAVADAGVDVFFMQGNRDFLVGEVFAERSGVELLPDELVIDLYGRKALLMHGDTLCTDDVEYQQLRHMLRNEQWQQDFLALPIEKRIEAALNLRAESQQKTAEKTDEIMDVNQTAVEQVMQKHGVDLLIHGHTHRMARHQFDLNANSMQRIVLGDWHELPHALEVNHSKMRLY
jgi:UDP-2,3-diacylglucosamine hydrolase